MSCSGGVMRIICNLITRDDLENIQVFRHVKLDKNYGLPRPKSIEMLRYLNETYQLSERNTSCFLEFPEADMNNGSIFHYMTHVMHLKICDDHLSSFFRCNIDSNPHIDFDENFKFLMKHWDNFDKDMWVRHFEHGTISNIVSNKYGVEMLKRLDLI